MARGAYAYNPGRADKLPNPENIFLVRTTSINFGGVKWFPNDGPIKVTVPSKNPVRLVKVLAGGADDQDTLFAVNLDSSYGQPAN